MRRFLTVLILLSAAVVPVFASGFVADVSAGDSFAFFKQNSDKSNSSLVTNEVKLGVDAGYAFSGSFALLADFEYAFSVASFKDSIGMTMSSYNYISGGLLGRYRNSSFMVDFGGGVGYDRGAESLGKGFFWFAKVVPAFQLFPFAGGNLGLDFTIPFEYRRMQYYSDFSVGVGVRLAFRAGMR